MSKPAPRRPCTLEEAQAVECLGQVRYPPASWDKRFARHMGEQRAMGAGITDKEAPQVWRLFHRYRRQITHPNKAQLLRLAGEFSAPDLRKQSAALRAQAEIDALKSKYLAAMQPKSQSPPLESYPAKSVDCGVDCGQKLLFPESMQVVEGVAHPSGVEPETF